MLIKMSKRFHLSALDHKNSGNYKKMHIKLYFSIYANSLLNVPAFLGHPLGDSQAVHCIITVDGCPIVAGDLSCPYL
jgi:hypothetical protein